MKCALEKCSNKATKLIGWNEVFEKGGIPLCVECFESYQRHDEARREWKNNK